MNPESLKGGREQMLERHKNEIDELQRKCKHKKLSKWREEWWAYAHSTGNIVKVCLNCGKIIKRKPGSVFSKEFKSIKDKPKR